MYPSKILSAAVLAATAAVTMATTGTAHAADTRALPSDVQVVGPGQLVDVGHGADLQLSRTQRCVGTPDAWECNSVVDGNQPPGTVSARIQGDATGTLYSPLYIGDGAAARMSVVSGGVTYDVHVVTLAGHPGYASGYVWGAPQPDPNDVPRITVYDRAGRVLAQL